MGAKNRVIKGDYEGELVYKEIFIENISIGNKKIISKKNVKEYEIIDEDKKKSGSSAVLRGALGIALLGGVGILAGLSAKSKGTYWIAIEFTDGTKSLMEINDKLYKVFKKSMF